MAGSYSDPPQAAARALADLHIFAAVQALMEHSLVSSKRFATEARIVKICKVEQARCLRDYDKAISACALMPGEETSHGK